jgi:hypothetical protein
MSRQNDDEFQARISDLLATVGPELRQLLKYIQDDDGMDRYLLTVEHAAATLKVEKISALFTSSPIQPSEELFFIRREAKETMRMHDRPETYDYIVHHPCFYEFRSRSVLLILWNRLPSGEKSAL